MAADGGRSLYTKARIIYGIILALTFSCCSSQTDSDDFGDLLLIGMSKSCVTDIGEEGVCVKASQCVVTPPAVDRATLFKIRTLSATTEKPVATNQCGWSTMCCPKTKVTTIDHNVKTPIQLGCGYSNPGGTSIRISNKATDAAYADFPWMVALMLKKNTEDQILEDKIIGGGTLIHPSVVMTVAHKVYKTRPNKLKCRAGEWNLSEESEQHKHQDRDVANVISHESYDNVYIYYDVALLVLTSQFDLASAPHIGVGCLEPNLPSPGTVCYSMGWGMDVRANNKSAKFLKKLELPLVGKDDCERLLRQTILGNGYNLHNSLTCAGGELGVDTCDGDGGSSLVCRIPDKERLRYSVVGMVAYGVDCWNQNVPGVYAKVPEFYDWVTSKMNSLYLQPTNSFKY